MSDSPPPHRLLILSDLHCLSQYGLVPRRYWPQGEVGAQPSAQFFRYMWECWEHFVAVCPPCEACIVNGDLIEGESPQRGATLDAITDNILTQAEACIETLGAIRERLGALWVIRGTEAHDQRHFEALELIGHRLNAESWGASGRRTGFVLDAEWRGLHINATHHMTSGWLYPAGGADRTALLARAAEAEGKAIPADIIIRSHLHQRLIVRAHGKWIVMTPAWKLLNPWVIKVREYYRALKGLDLGAIVLETDGTGSITWREFGYAPYTPQEHALARTIETDPTV